MPKKFIKRYLPHPDKIKDQKSLRIFGNLLYQPNLWYLNRRSLPRAVAIGLFCAFLPIPFQMVVAAALALIVSANLPLSVVLVWITNPITMPAIFYFTYKVGTWILQMPARTIHVELSWAWLSHQFVLIWKPLLLGSILCGAISAVIGFWLMRLIWHLWLVKQAHLRRQKQRNS